MITRLVVNSSIFGSFAWFSTVIDIPDNFNNKPLSAKITDSQRNNFTTRDLKNMTLEDVEMFERARGCKLVFTDSFEKSKNYSAKGWFNEKMRLDSKNKEKLRETFADGVVYQQTHCKKGEILVLDLQGAYKNIFKPRATFKFET